MPQPADEQRVIDAEVAHTAELLRQREERERERAEEHREEEEHWRNEQENQRLGAELGREEAEHDRRDRGTGASAEQLELRERVAALERTVAALVRARQGRAGGGRRRASSDEPTTDVPRVD